MYDTQYYTVASLQHSARVGRRQVGLLRQRIAEMDCATRLEFAIAQIPKFERIARDCRSQSGGLDGEDRQAMADYADDVDSVVMMLRSAFLALETQTRH